MTSVACALVLLLLAPQAIGEVESHFDKKADFSAYRTYTWSKGHQAYDPAAHKAIVAAIEAQMAALGFTQVDKGADVFLTYHTVRSSEVDLKMLDKLKDQGQDTSAATKILGRLAVVLSNPTSRAALWSAGTRRRLSDDPSKWQDEVRLAVASLFETYPSRKKNRD
jgi:Domain of unknown function (DUF4136)